MLKQVILTLLFLGIAVNAKVTPEDMASANRALEAAIALENQCETSADCTTVAVGSRACGGPGGYAVYAIKSSNADEIHSLAQLTTKLARQYNSENSVMSICSMARVPRPVCDETNKCVAGPASSSSFDSVF